MRRIKVQLKDLKPNPYKKDIQGGLIDPEVVARIKESANKTSFWEQWVVREVGTKYELAFGHHRLVAAKELFGGSYEVSVQLEDYSDEQMLVALADENAGDEESPAAQMDVVRIAREYIIEHPEACKFQVIQRESDEKRGGNNPHEHGSNRCVAAFLGEANWNQPKVSRLSAMDTLAPEAKALIAPPTGSREGGHGTRPGELGQQAAVALTRLSKPAQVAAAKVISKTEEVISKAAVERAVKEVVAQKLSPQDERKAITNLLEEASSEVEVRAVTKKALKTMDKAKKDKSAPDIGDFALRICRQLDDSPDHEAVLQLLEFKTDLPNYALKDLKAALARHAKRIDGYLRVANDESKQLKERN